MILPYGLRLALLSAASFFVVYAAASLLVCALVPALARRTGGRPAGRGADSLARWRLMPLTLAGFAVIALCVPGYLRFEPDADAERAGVLCTVAALLGAGIILTGLARAGHAWWLSLRSAREFRRGGRQIQLPGEAMPVTALESDAPLVALTGVLRSRVVVSRGLLRALSSEQLEAALRHEQAHRTAGDNGKRLLFLLAPDPFGRMGRFAALERSWARLAEWAADDRAAAGDARRALTLAETLVLVARLGRAPVHCAVAAHLISDRSGLRERVQRLVEFAGQPAEPAHPTGNLGFSLAILAGVLLVAAAWQSPVLYSAHRVLEALLR